MEQQAQNTVWTTGFLPNGMKASFTFVISDPMNAFAEAMAYLSKLQADGLQMREPGLEAGEQSYTVTHIARRTQNNKKKDGTTSSCPLIDIYHDDLAYSSLKTWLNTPDEIADFERITGLKLEAIKTFPGTAAVKRGESTDADAFVYKLPHSVKAIWTLNPDYVEGSTTQQKRLFARWEVAGNAPQSSQKAVSSGSEGEQLIWNTDAVKQLCSKHELSTDQLKRALNITDKFSEWTLGYVAADKAAIAYKQTLELDFMS